MQVINERREDIVIDIEPSEIINLDEEPIIHQAREQTLLTPDQEDHSYDPLNANYGNAVKDNANGLFSSLVADATLPIQQNLTESVSSKPSLNQIQDQQEDGSSFHQTKDNSEIGRNIPKMVDNMPSEDLKRLQAKLSQFIDKRTGGLADSEISLNRLLETMKGEIELDC
jgi:hypothetical protein